MSGIKYCRGLTLKGERCKRKTKNNDLCNIHHYKTEECPICLEEKPLYKLNCCQHVYCRECKKRLYRCGICRKEIKLTLLDSKKLFTCNTIIITVDEFAEKASITKNRENKKIYKELYKGLVEEFKKIAKSIYNNYYREKYKKIFK